MHISDQGDLGPISGATCISSDACSTEVMLGNVTGLGRQYPHSKERLGTTNKFRISDEIVETRVRQKDVGADSLKLVKAMELCNPDKTSHRTDDNDRLESRASAARRSPVKV